MSSLTIESDFPETANPPHGERGTFRKITATLPPGDYRKLVEESARRKASREPNQLLSSLVREALSAYLRQLHR